ncbi:hypothetical protein EBQ81_04375 [bacterium]|nr:hypothetical protein [bacterium]
MTTILLSGILVLLVVGFLLISIGENDFFMYRNVLLTDKEIAILKTVISQTLHEKVSIDRNNLTIIHNRLRQIIPLKTNNQFFNYGK